MSCSWISEASWILLLSSFRAIFYLWSKVTWDNFSFIFVSLSFKLWWITEQNFINLDKEIPWWIHVVSVHKCYGNWLYLICHAEELKIICIDTLVRKRLSIAAHTVKCGLCTVTSKEHSIEGMSEGLLYHIEIWKTLPQIDDQG